MSETPKTSETLTSQAASNSSGALLREFAKGRRCFACFEYDDDRCTLEC